MADIEADRAWMRQRAKQQAQETETARRKEDQRLREEAAKTCRYCFHPTHEIQYGSGSWSGNPEDDWVMETCGPPVILYCRTGTCTCGVPPCRTCGSRTRIEGSAFGMERCNGCGAEWQGAVYA